MQKAQRPRRPVWVWIISLGYGLVALGGIVNTVLLHSGVLPTPEPYRSQLDELGVLQWGPSLVGAALMLAYCVSLFRLRRVAVQLCEALMAVSFATTAFQLARIGVPAGLLGTFALASTTFSLGLLVTIYLYSRHLRTRGILG